MGYTAERFVHDYGIDLLLFTYDANGEAEAGYVLLQVKSTTSLRVLADQHTIAHSIRRADLERWLREPLPVILVVYDARRDVAYWVYIQAYFAHRAGVALEQRGTVTVHVLMTNRVDPAAIRRFVLFRDAILDQPKGVIHHHG